MVTAKPSLLVTAFAAIGLCAFLLGGGIYDILVKPPIMWGNSFVSPRIHDQVLLESLTAMIVYAMGVTGLLVTYQSTKYAYKPRQAFMLLLVGCALIIIAYLYIENIIWLKMSAPL